VAISEDLPGGWSEPLTPDFYQYRWQPLTSVRLQGSTVVVGWADGTELACYSLWLAENADGLGLHPQTRECMVDPGDLPSPEALTEASLGPRGELSLRWSLPTGALITEVHPGWLRHIADGGQLPEASLPSIETWTAATFGEPPSVSGEAVLEDDAVLAEWLSLLCRFGIARLQNTPTDQEFCEQLGRRIGPIRGSNFGAVFSVQAMVEPNSTANTGLGLGQHTDLPTRETPPGFQLLHCVVNNVAGGFSRLTDGHSVVNELRTSHAEHYEALTTLNWVFANRSATDDHRWTGPFIDHSEDGLPLTLRAFSPVRGFPAMSPADVPRAYAALRAFSEVAHDPRFQIRFAFAPGDVVGFDNRRVLHGRDGFAEGGGLRLLRGCYMDHDDLYSRLRVLNRRSAARIDADEGTQNA